ncbi:hypothetical protein Tco_0755963 [Tanacetum coccineum]
MFVGHETNLTLIYTCLDDAFKCRPQVHTTMNPVRPDQKEPVNTRPWWKLCSYVFITIFKTAEEILARERERKARTTLLMALPEDHLAKFHKMTDAKDMWDAIKSRFGGNDESKKMQKYILKQQFEGFSVSNSEGLHKGYDRFQSLLSQLEIHGAGVSTEDANQKFLRSLPSSWSQVSLVMRTKPGVDNLSIDDLYNNLRVFESDIKGSTGSSSSAQNVAFVSSESTNSTNDVSTAYGVSTSSGYNSQRENSSSYTDELMYSFFANQSSGPHLDHEDLEQLDEFDLEEMAEMGVNTETISKRDKSGLGYGDQVHDGVLSYGNEVFQSVFDSRSSDVEDSPVHDRFANVEGMHAVPPPMTGNYMPPGPDREVDNYMFTYGSKQSKTSKSDTQTSNFDSCESNSSIETLESYESDSDDEYVIQPSKEQEKPSSAFVKHVKTPREKLLRTTNTLLSKSKLDSETGMV